MHRYFARRPYSIFQELIRHYSRPNEVLVDPFCGGGVTLVEGVIQNRRVIGFDINPLSTFITRMELSNLDVGQFRNMQEQVIHEFGPSNDALFVTQCRRCGREAHSHWFEYSARTKCPVCESSVVIANARKHGIGIWQCSKCGSALRFSPEANTDFTIIHVYYTCERCRNEEVANASETDFALVDQINKRLRCAEANGLWIPTESIPDCNMQRESALFKKNIFLFRQFFTNRHLMALALLRQLIVKVENPIREWLLFAFSSTLRYTNRMVTRNPGWRGNRPLEWAKPGFWLPAVHLEANVLEEFERRCDAIVRGKKDYLSRVPRIPDCASTARSILAHSAPSFHIDTHSATRIPLPDESVDAIITDPPYGSYVHYADLSNFWSVWLPEIQGLGRIIDDSEEAVIARKNFPNAKNTNDYRRILERCFSECHRILRNGRYMVLTFHNREPRAWAALLAAAVKAGFQLPEDGVLFHAGIASYRHTAQSRRAGSIIGDFVLSFRKTCDIAQDDLADKKGENWASETELVNIVKRIIRKKGPLAPDALMQYLYKIFVPTLIRRVQAAVSKGENEVEKLVSDFEAVGLFNSHQRQLLERHLVYKDGKWTV